MEKKESEEVAAEGFPISYRTGKWRSR